ncbi:uncharacterized protein [Rutidosis leptorrhynchoides]|uniref:uncharacterized protein n=1 Tax=Rutidosis leptorrhynchoides TaxID=125765 RepID=UPI003A99676B
MSDNVPFEIQIEIIKRLHVKPLVRCRSVSKSWKSIIDSSDFIANYHLCNTQLQHRLLARYVDSEEYRSNIENGKYVSIVDDDSFPRQKSPLIVPSDVTLLGSLPDIIGSSQGVLCLCDIYDAFDDEAHLCDTMTFVLWNPTIRKSINIVVSNVINKGEFETVVGFGVCPRNGGHKIRKKNLILSFDMTTEEFTEIDLPNNLAYLRNGDLSLSTLYTSLVVVETKYVAEAEYCVWRMEQGVPNLFTRLFVIKSPCVSLQIQAVHDFRKTGEPIIEMFLDTDDAQNAVFVYEPESEEISDIGLAGFGLSCLAKSYIETLVLLDK